MFSIWFGSNTVANLRYGPVSEGKDHTRGKTTTMLHKTKAFPWKVEDAEQICNHFEKSRDSRRQALKEERMKEVENGADTTTGENKGKCVRISKEGIKQN